ncbi:ParA family protein [Halomonas sp. KO116]|uniref:ParA family protein n=1 Tax=Halomonas sp. KO116 TaxID=1504981 RepID=UPI0004E32628|nr:ParA family protein [Halomonas sp. KO116]AJY53317.1 Cobyrinic acid ac-diamide synthase [Halomonas sp. KO116]
MKLTKWGRIGSSKQDGAVVTKILSLAAHKGGVGKTTTTVLLAHYLSSNGYKVLVVDNDAQGNTTSVLTLNPDGTYVPFSTIITADLYQEGLDGSVEPIHCSYGIDVIPCPANCDRFRQLSSEHIKTPWIFSDNLNDLCQQYDVVLIDCSSNYSNNVNAALVLSTHVLCPVKMTGHGIDGVLGLMKTISEVQSRHNHELKFLGCFLNLMESRGKRIQENSNRLREALGDDMLKNVLHRRPPIDTIQDEGGTLAELGYAHVAVKEVNQLMEEIVERLYA